MGPVSPQFAFDVCHEIYSVCQQILTERLRTSSVENSLKYLWRPQVRPRLSDYCADFRLAGECALGIPELASRMIMFRVYYVALAPYPQARRFIGISELSWSNWADEIRVRVGKELMRRGLFPPRQYFRN